MDKVADSLKECRYFFIWWIIIRVIMRKEKVSEEGSEKAKKKSRPYGCLRNFLIKFC